MRSGIARGASAGTAGAVRRWFDSHTFGAHDLPGAELLAARKQAEGLRVSVAIPALNEEPTIGIISRAIRTWLTERTTLVDELVVVDGGSTDRTAAVALAAGADVRNAADLLPEVPYVAGKGESLWRSLSALSGDIVVWVDADIRNFGPHFVSRLVAPLLLDPEISFVKGFYTRPIQHDGILLPSGGGRVTELLARPLFNSLFPELAGFLQPLAGEYAGRREVLERVPFFTGYSVEVGMLIDLLDLVGLDALAQADLERRVHRNRPLGELAPMACAIGGTILQRAVEWGRLDAEDGLLGGPVLLPGPEGNMLTRWVREVERPPMRLLRDGAVADLFGRELAVAGSR